MTRFALVLALVALGAFVLPSAASGAQKASKSHRLSFGRPVVLPKSGDTGGASNTCYNPCGEPSMVVGPDGTLYVSTPRTLLVCCNTLASPLWKSHDNGTTWSEPIFPPAPADAGNAFTGGDTELAVDKRGTVFEGELWLGNDTMYMTADGGESWQWSPVSHDPVDDREWLVYAQNEDALYGVYDAIPRGLEVIRVPLNSPLGPQAALAHPEAHVIAPYWDDCPGVVAGPCQTKPEGVLPDAINGTPYLEQSTAPGRPAVDPVDGTVYFPFPYQVAGKGVAIAMTTDGASTWQYRYVRGAGHSGHMDTGNDFPVAAVDQHGNLYVSWVENKGAGLHLYLSASQDKGLTWTDPLDVSGSISGTATFPNIVAGANGRVAVSWFGTTAKGDPNKLPDARWSVYVAQTLNALAAKPAFNIGVIQSKFHKGNVCTHGLGCTTNDRKLLDFFDMAIDAKGALLVVYARDVGATKTEIAFSRQSDGCSLVKPHTYANGAAAKGGAC